MVVASTRRLILGNLKSEEAVRRNVVHAIAFLEGRERFIGRDKP